MTYEKCTRCGWFNGAKSHVCITPTAELSPAQRRLAYEAEAGLSPRHLTDTHKEAMSETQKDRWRARTADRDVAIVDRYAEGEISYVGLADEFNVSKSTIITVMKKAKAVGAHHPRRPGLNLKNGA